MIVTGGIGRPGGLIVSRGIGRIITEIPDLPGSGSGRHRGTSPYNRAMRDDQEIIEMLASWINGKPN